MKRHGTKIEDGTVYIEADTGWLEVGALADIFAVVGGEKYEIEYDEKEAAYYAWLDTDERDVMTIDVRETIADMTYPGEFIEELRDRSMDVREEYPERTAYFAEVMVRIWDSKGNIDDDDSNPFT